MINRAVFFNDFDSEWIEFKNPIDEYRANSLEDVIPTLNSIDEKLGDNIYVVGFISYEAASAFDPALKTKESTAFPLCWFGLYNQLSKIDPTDYVNKSYAVGKWVSSVNKKDYYQNFRKITEYIIGGYSYQVNYTYRLRAKFSGDPYSYFWDLYDRQETRYAAYLDLGDMVICSVSPELFFKLDGNTIKSKPMKGTASRGKNLFEDKENIDRLYHSAKDRAENTMIVDMMRNDLGRIAETGSVRVESLYDIERYQTVLQMTSSVQAKTTTSLSRIFASMFPCASVTGAPKCKTTEIISELESTPRKVYTGTIGFVLPQRKAQFNVAIRTVLIDRKLSQAEYGVGGGIVWDSEHMKEYEESRTKVKVLTEKERKFDLLETMLWTPADGYFLLDYHLKRLANSAEYFAFSINLDGIKQEMNNASNKFQNNPHRVRILLSKDGHTTITSDIIPNYPRKETVSLTLAKTHVDSSDRMLFHKTTNRQIYEDAKRMHPNSDDVILVNEQGEITETTLYNIVLQINGKYITPQLSSGLLPGTFRAWLLCNNKVEEKSIRVSDLKKCDQIFVINSVRKWQRAVFV